MNKRQQFLTSLISEINKSKPKKQAIINRLSELETETKKDYNHISYQNGGYKFIYCHNCLPFTAYKVGDYIEIDLEIMANNKFKHVFNENKNVIQGISCEANQPPHNLPTLFVEENFSQALTIG
ncbi:19107_t:CDS:2 [Entrophospora sp. SA101]|nr:19107_t:CDS:2 [Entrophospora sp. SA101]